MLLSLTALLILTGCLGLDPKPDPSRYFVLRDTPAQTTAAPVDCGRTVLVGPVTLAGYLNNPKIALRRGANEIGYQAWDFWAAPLSRSLPRELISSLAVALPDTCVSSYRRASVDATSIQLEILIEQFEMTDNGNVVVAASWGATSDNGAKRRQGQARVTRSYQSGDVVSGVQALTVALDELAKKIAEDLR
jgi:uncharacterized lipoprotein YmbA